MGYKYENQIERAELLVYATNETDLAGVVVLRVEQITELRQQLRPGLQLSFRGNGCDQDPFRTDSKEGYTKLDRNNLQE